VTLRQFWFLVALQLAAANGTVIDFDKLSVGAAPPGWTVAAIKHGTPARWEVRQDESAPTPPYVLAQVSNDPSDDRYPLAILDGMNFRDGEISVRIKPLSGREDQGGGVVWRYRDENNYYLVRANANNNTVAVFRVQHGQRVAIQPGVKHDVPANAWSILKVVVRGNRYQVYVDHRRIMEGVDSALTGSGKVGLCTVADSVMYFDDFRVTPR
jgi:hypothetical protein